MKRYKRIVSPLFDHAPSVVATRDTRHPVWAKVVDYSNGAKYDTPGNLTITTDILAVEKIETEYVLCCTIDNILLERPKDILAKAAKLGNIIFASKPVFGGTPDILYKYLRLCNHHSPYRFLCPDIFIGRADAARKCCALAAKYGNFDDVYINHFPLIAIDNFCELFVVLQQNNKAVIDII